MVSLVEAKKMSKSYI